MAIDTPLATVEGMLNGVIDRDLDAVLNAFTKSPDAYMYVEGPRWTTRGGDHVETGWRAYFEAGVGIDSFTWVEGPQVLEGQELSAVLGVIDYTVKPGGRVEEPHKLRLRMTYVTRREPEGWRIVHEHGSQPLADPYGSGDWWPEGAEHSQATPTP